MMSVILIMERSLTDTMNTVSHDPEVTTEVEPQVSCVRLRGRINLNFSTTYAVDCGA